jgi:hypothetical protein
VVTLPNGIQTFLAKKSLDEIGAHFPNTCLLGVRLLTKIEVATDPD